MATAVELAVIGIVFCLLLWGISTALLQWWRSNDLLKQLRVASQPMLASDIQIIETELPLAFSLGIFKPATVISTGLISRLSSQQLDIVRAHETIHSQYRDGLYKWVLHFMCSFHWPKIKRILLSEHAISLEIRADQQVALNIQNNIAVAETIVKVQRLMSPIKPDVVLCQFLGSELEQRVHYLLATSSGSVLSKHSIRIGLLCFLTLTVCGSIPLHNAIEAFITRH
jgi:beta-lactamase regulating signal transducer with metallopeptidase domain